jgi:cephalosporin hydroxylase
MTDCMLVPGAQVTASERVKIRSLAQIISHYNPHPVVVNIGIMWGCTLWCLREGAPEANLFGIDIAPDKWPIQDRTALNATIIQADSRTCPFHLPIDLLLIDGDRHYATVKADIENWTPRLGVGGVVIFHDYSPTANNLRQFPELEGVKRAVDEWAAAHPEFERQANAPGSLQVFMRLQNGA